MSSAVQYRSEWSKYALGCDAVIFVVDAGEKARAGQAKFELHKMLDSPGIKGIPLLVIGNKIDLVDHMRQPEIIESELTRAGP